MIIDKLTLSAIIAVVFIIGFLLSSIWCRRTNK
jgi:uncharacterized membrane protein YciS (DUF1049 family)